MWRTDARICQVLKSEVFNFLCNVVYYLHLTHACSFAIHDSKKVYMSSTSASSSQIYLLPDWLNSLEVFWGIQIQLSGRTLSYLRTLGRFSSSSEIVLAGSAVTIICQFLTHRHLRSEQYASLIYTCCSFDI